MDSVLKELKDKFLTSIRYEDLSQWEVGKAVITEAVNHWDSTGLLDGIEDQNKKEILAVAFDNMAYDLIFENERVIKLANRYNFNCKPDSTDSEENNLSFDFAVIVFPILRRVICGNIYKNCTDNFNYDKFVDYLEKYSFLAINYDGYEKNENVDIEVEFAAILSTIFIELFDKNK